ncbi:MAG: hypothetical protein Q7S27_06465 [Nanoarchaeota archaeon]|nr:hypothetical protein [Nanoarchaeota archaeon]
MKFLFYVLLFGSLISLVGAYEINSPNNETIFSWLEPPDIILFQSPLLSISFLLILGILTIFILRFLLRVKLPKIGLSDRVLRSLFAISIFIFIAAWYWDGWWHVALGRDRFFSPPHVSIYINLFILFFSTLFLYKGSNNRIYAVALFTQSISLFCGIVDIFWHGYFGVEKLISPLIVWSPPHMASFASIFIGMVFILQDWIKQYSKNKDQLQFFQIVLLSGSAFSVLGILTSPLQPLGWHHILGVWGIVITTFFAAFYLIYLAYKMPQTGIVTLTMLILIVFITFESHTFAPGLSLPPHATPPFWLHFHATILAVVWLDFINLRKYRPVLMGTISGFLLALVYAIFWRFVQNETFSYSFNESILFVIAGTIGGSCAGLLYNYINKRKIIE